jgi:sugar O-acyltransferase (sialic acid O-acetyltransferase NeuD family)
MKDLVIYGMGGFGREVHQIVEDVNQDRATWNFLGFLDDDPDLRGAQAHGYPDLGGMEWLEQHPGTAVVLSTGNPVTRWKIVKRLAAIGHTEFATLVHPRAWVGNRVCLGRGTIIHAAASVTTDVTIGDHVILNKNCTVGHDVVIGDFVFVAPNVLIGCSEIGEGTFFGASSSAVNYLPVGSWSIVGAGTVVLKELPSNVTAVGVPARIVDRRENGWQAA